MKKYIGYPLYVIALLLGFVLSLFVISLDLAALVVGIVFDFVIMVFAPRYRAEQIRLANHQLSKLPQPIEIYSLADLFVLDVANWAEVLGEMSDSVTRSVADGWNINK